MNTKKLVITAVTATLALGITACGSSTPEEPASAKPAGNGGEYGLPADVTKFTIGTSVGTAPYEYYEAGSNEVAGYEPDLLAEVADRLGVEIEWNPTDFGAMFSALEAGRTDFIANGLIDRKSRQADFDMLDYIKDASGFLGLEGTTAQLKTMEDVCGHSLAVPSGTTWEGYFDEQSKKCIENGDEKIEIVLVKDPTAATLAVTSKRVEFAVNQQPLLAFAAQQTQGLEVGDLTYLEGVVAMAFPKDSDLLEPVQKVLDEMIADGTYLEILEKWGMDDLAVEKTSVNAGTAE
ncbi:ABC transporter substrate-binding protein [Microbacterium sp.]|uniref:ABC transporter substrate-binding protein n=1 Tax=Microbacterium sp. TaxID=51671 RepID=UPI002810C20D|nr:ABC transporter substrate-binding protein [Microbacterium sp.]